MAEPDSKTELSKEVLAPQQEIREDLVATAVKFLQNPKVTQSPLSQKRTFLQRKGLTDEEVEAAIHRAGATDSAPAQTGGDKYAAPGGPGQTLVQYPAIPPKIQEPVYSRWMKTRDMLAVISVVTGLSYAAYKLYKELLRPLLFGIPSTDQRVATLEKNMSDSMDKISQTLASIEQVLGKQQEKLQMISHDVNSKATSLGMGSSQKETSVSELKSELVSIKGLLLNRRQFPSVPASTPSIPSWQLPQASGDNSNDRGKDEEDDDDDISGRKSPEISVSPLPSPLTASGDAETAEVKLSKSEYQASLQNENLREMSNDLVEESLATVDSSIGDVKVEVKGANVDADSVVNRVQGITDGTDDNVDRDLNKDDDADSN